jgi:hypothetical protein
VGVVVLVIVGVFVQVVEGLGANLAKAVIVEVGVFTDIVELGGVVISKVVFVKALQPTTFNVKQTSIRAIIN